MELEFKACLWVAKIFFGVCVFYNRNYYLTLQRDSIKLFTSPEYCLRYLMRLIGKSGLVYYSSGPLFDISRYIIIKEKLI